MYILEIILQFSLKYFVTIVVFCSFISFCAVSLSYCLPRRSARYRRKSAKKAYNVLQKISHDGQKFAYLRKLDPFVFEELLLTAFEKKGHAVARNTRYTGDGGIDGRVEIDGKWHLIQAKRYKSSINPRHVESFSHLCSHYQCAGFFIHTGRTGARSHKVKGGRVIILSGKRLLNLLRQTAPADSKSA